MTQRTKTVLIVTGVLVVALVVGLLTGQLQELFDDVGTIVGYVFNEASSELPSR